MNEGAFDTHLQSGTPDSGINPCDYCHVSTDTDYLYRHEASGDRLCQDCLGKYLELDIEDSDDHKGHFEGWTFSRSGFVGMFEATHEEEMTPPFKTVGEVLECVLISKRYI